MKVLSLFVAFVAFFSYVLAGGNSTNSLILSTTTIGTVVQTFVLQTQTVTTCPCNNGTKATATGGSSGGGVPALPTFQGKSSAHMVRPYGLFAIIGCMAVMSGMVMFA